MNYLGEKNMKNKKITVLLVLSLFVMSIIPFTLIASSIESHDTASGTTYSYYIGTTATQQFTTGMGVAWGNNINVPRWQSFQTNNTLAELSNITRIGLVTSGNADVRVGITDSSNTWIEYDDFTITETGSSHWEYFDIDPVMVSTDTEYRIRIQKLDASSPQLSGYAVNYYLDGEAGDDNSRDYSFRIYGYNHSNVTITRASGGISETNNVSFTPTRDQGETDLVIPVSYSVSGINNVTNQTSHALLDEVNTSGDLADEKFWYDSANHNVVIRIDSVAPTTYKYFVNATYGSNFTYSCPKYLEVGDYLMIYGMVKDSSGNPAEVTALTRVLYGNGTSAINPMEWNCTDGNYQCVLSTSHLIPGIYQISIEIADPLGSGVTEKFGDTLYLSTSGGTGHFTAESHFSFYNNNTGMGVDKNLFQIYVDDNTTLTDIDRIYDNIYKTYIGQTLYYRIDDYFNNKIYPPNSNYTEIEIAEIDQFIDIPIDWYSLAVKNLNETIMFFSMENGSRYYNVTLFPGDSIHINVLEGSYNITKMFYSGYNGSLLSTETDIVNIIADAFYISTGYNAMIHISWYNTNEGLGLPDETLKLYFNGNRSTSMNYPTYINSTVNITVKDYYNTTLYTNIFTINNTRTFLDLGLTFHSYLFSDKNDDYYMVSLLKQGGTRWWERGIVPYGEREFLIPSGNYMMRIYDKDDTEIYNTTTYDPIINSRVYVIHGTNLSLIINGQSKIKGQLLELQTELAEALRPSIVKRMYNAPHVYCLLERIGTMLGIEEICPLQVMTATTRNTSEINSSTVFVPLMPDNSSSTKTILTKKDIMYFSGNSSVSWVNLTYTDNGTLLSNTTYTNKGKLVRTEHNREHQQQPISIA